MGTKIIQKDMIRIVKSMFIQNKRLLCDDLIQMGSI